MVAAHKIYVPLKASQPDLETSLHMNELVQLARGMNPKLQAVALIALAPTNPVINETAEAQKILRELSEFTPSQVIIRDRKVYRDAMTEGQGVVELGNDKATAEIEALAREIYG